jgi:hypothetical protein
LPLVSSCPRKKRQAGPYPGLMDESIPANMAWLRQAGMKHVNLPRPSGTTMTSDRAYDEDSQPMRMVETTMPKRRATVGLKSP